MWAFYFVLFSYIIKTKILPKCFFKNPVIDHVCMYGYAIAGISPWQGWIWPTWSCPTTSRWSTPWWSSVLCPTCTCSVSGLCPCCRPSLPTLWSTAVPRWLLHWARPSPASISFMWPNLRYYSPWIPRRWAAGRVGNSLFRSKSLILKSDF